MRFRKSEKPLNPRESFKRAKIAGGFTLVEALVVVLLVSLLLSVGYPFGQRMLSSYESKVEIERISQQLTDLRESAKKAGEGFWVVSESFALSPERVREELQIPMTYSRRSLSSDSFQIGQARPILVHPSGYCEGGRLSLEAENAEVRHYQLKAPFCRLEPL